MNCMDLVVICSHYHLIKFYTFIFCIDLRVQVFLVAFCMKSFLCN